MRTENLPDLESPLDNKTTNGLTGHLAIFGSPKWKSISNQCCVFSNFHAIVRKLLFVGIYEIAAMNNFM